jgi:hypothetical protein
LLYRWRWWIWGAFVLAWTVALLAPIPPNGPLGLTGFELKPKLFLTKGLHLSAYAFLAVLTGWLRVPIRYRFILIFFLMAHATYSEVLQYALEEYSHRSGTLMDVALDNIGIAIGLALSWRWWTRS